MQDGRRYAFLVASGYARLSVAPADVVHQKLKRRMRQASWLAFRRFHRWPTQVRIAPEGHLVVVVESTSLVLTSGDRLKQFHRIVICSWCRCEFPWPERIESRAQLQGPWPAVLCHRCSARCTSG